MEEQPALRVTPRTKSSYAADKLREALLEGRYATGAWLRTAGLAAELGLSLTPVREALVELATEGLVEMVPYRGARVAEIPGIDLTEVYLVRGLLESAAASLAATRATPQELARLHKLHANFAKAVKSRSRSELRALNDEFHFAIYDAARSPLVRRLIELAWARSPRDTFTLLPTRAALSLQDHTAIVSAISARNPEQAQSAMRQHIDAALALILEHQAGVWKGGGRPSARKRSKRC